MSETAAPLIIRKDHVVRFHYRIRDSAGEELEASKAETPEAVLLGRGGVLPGVEKALLGRKAGENFTVVVEPEDAFGERSDDAIERVSKKRLPKGVRPTPGMSVYLQLDDGPRTVTIVKVGNKVVDVDLNHPYAGVPLTVSVTIVDVREATSDELAHGHPLGPGGHHH